MTNKTNTANEVNSDWATNIYRETIKLGEDWADKDSAKRHLEDTKKTVLAQIASQFEGSEAAKMNQALASGKYINHLEEMRKATYESNLASVRYDAIKLLGSLRQSQESTRRAEMKLT
jgi:hypothetical protein